MKKKKVYVTGEWSDAIEQKLIDKNYQIITSCNIKNNSPDNLSGGVETNLENISSADIVLAIMPNKTDEYNESFVEIGYALGQNKKIIILNDGAIKFISTELDPSDKELQKNYYYTHQCMENEFYHHPDVKHVTTLDEVNLN